MTCCRMYPRILTIGFSLYKILTFRRIVLYLSCTVFTLMKAAILGCRNVSILYNENPMVGILGYILQYVPYVRI